MQYVKNTGFNNSNSKCGLKDGTNLINIASFSDSSTLQGTLTAAKVW